ncbi:MAG TPA: WD40 repeat domain-containing protein [Candidatus Krumholzibacteria bacterium]|nr:WD40 repeat domain-containing protein [Candidatus Krumholzibacteria bacterium]
MDSERWQKVESLFDAALDLPTTLRPAFLERECQDDPALRAEVESLLVAHAANEGADSIIAAAAAIPTREEPEQSDAAVEPISEDTHLPGPVIARADTRGYRVSRFVRRNRTLVASLTLVFASLVAGLAVSIALHREADRQRDVAEALTREAQAQTYVSAIAAGEASIRMNQIGEARSQLEQAPEHLRGWEWRHLVTRLDRSLYMRDAHGAGITRVAFTPDGTMFATSSLDSTCGLWRTDSGDSVRRWGPLPAGAESIAIHPAGTMVAAGLSDGTVLVWDIASGQEKARLAGAGWAMVAFSPDGKKLAAGFQNQKFSEWNAATFELIRTVDTEGAFLCVAYAADSRTLLTGDHAGHVALWDTRRGRQIGDIPAHERRVMNLVFNEDGSLLATASMDRSVKVWRMPDRALVTAFRGHDATVAGIAFDNDGRVVSAGADHAIILWDAVTGAVTTELRGGGEDVYAVAVSPDGGYILTGSQTGRVRLWARNTEDVRTFRVPEIGYMQSAANHARISQDGILAACAADRADVLLWNADTGDYIAGLETGRADFPTRVTFNPDGSRLYAGDGGGHIIVFDTASRRRLLAFSAHATAIRGLDVSPGGAVLASASDDSTIRFWDAATLAPRGELRGHDGPVTRVVFAPGGAVMASASGDRTIRLWNAHSGDTLRVFRMQDDEAVDIAFNPGGSRLVSVSKAGAVRLWETESGRALGEVGTGRGRPLAACFTPDGTRIVIGGDDQIVRVVDAESRREVARLHGHVGRILSLEPCPTRNAIISTSFDGTIRLWDAPAPVAARVDQ